ncbi:MAG: hypothetical protein CME67_00185 [Halobacteriovoraceae bacterium]|nr:hypothetical protein [Halobacteriovoraceae bacterium]
MEVHIIKTNDIYLNLALEQVLFLELPAGTRRLLIWKDAPCIVMGRFQNPWVECDLEGMKRDGVLLARRQSGGGTVYHDQGNVNVSFMDWNEVYDKDVNNSIMIKTLGEYGHKAVSSGRSDIQIITPDGNRKVSGAAFKKKRDRTFHHATMLLNSNLDNLNRYLIPKIGQDNVQTKAISSVRSKVANTNIKEEDFIKSLIRNYEIQHGQSATVKVWSEHEAKEKVLLNPDYLNVLMSWKWICAETPLFKTKIESGNWEVDIAIKKGVIQEVELEHGSIHPGFLSDLSSTLKLMPLRKEVLEHRFSKLELDMYKEQVLELKALIDEYFIKDFEDLA